MSPFSFGSSIRSLFNRLTVPTTAATTQEQIPGKSHYPPIGQPPEPRSFDEINDEIDTLLTNGDFTSLCERLIKSQPPSFKLEDQTIDSRLVATLTDALQRSPGWLIESISMECCDFDEGALQELVTSLNDLNRSPARLPFKVQLNLDFGSTSDFENFDEVNKALALMVEEDSTIAGLSLSNVPHLFVPQIRNQSLSSLSLRECRIADAASARNLIAAIGNPAMCKIELGVLPNAKDLEFPAAPSPQLRELHLVANVPDTGGGSTFHRSLNVLLSNTPHLERLHLERIKLSDDLLDTIRGMSGPDSSLRRLTLRAAAMNAQRLDALFNTLRDNPPLIHLDLANNAIADLPNLALVGNHHLQRLNLSHNRDLSPACIASLISQANLDEIDLSGIPFNPEGIQILTAAPGFKRLTSLSLSQCGLTDKCLEQLAKDGVLARLKHLNIAANRLTEASLQLLVDALIDRSTLLESLAIGSRGITKQLAENLKEAVGKNRNLLQLDHKSWFPGEKKYWSRDDIETVDGYLKRNRRLRSPDLRANDVLILAQLGEPPNVLGTDIAGSVLEKLQYDGIGSAAQAVENLKVTSSRFYGGRPPTEAQGTTVSEQTQGNSN